MTQLALGALGGIQLAPDVLDEQRGAWCSPPEYTEAAGTFDVDPFTNPRSTLIVSHTCMLERGDDGFGLDRHDVPGTYYINPEHCKTCLGRGPVRRAGCSDLDPQWPGPDGKPRGPVLCATYPNCSCGIPDRDCPDCGYHVATVDTRVWIQPPYDIVLAAIAHYGHTRFTALLRLDTSTLWFEQLYALSEVIMVPRRDRLEFVPPPGVKPSSNPFPHGLYYRRAEDVTPAIASLCFAWPTPNYPAADPLQLRRAA